MLALCVCKFQTLNPCIMFGGRLSTAYHSLFPRAWASLFRQTRHSRRPKAPPTTSAVSSTTLVAQNRGGQVLSVDIDICSRDLHYKVKGARSNKAWAFFQQPSAVYDLLLVLAIVNPLEKVMWAFFKWQRDALWKTHDMAKAPLVAMTNMAHSPAACAVDHLSKMMTISHSDSHDDLAYATQELPARVLLTLLKRGAPCFMV
jgi:hypothetical protein